PGVESASAKNGLVGWVRAGENLAHPIRRESLGTIPDHLDRGSPPDARLCRPQHDRPRGAAIACQAHENAPMAGVLSARASRRRSAARNPLNEVGTVPEMPNCAELARRNRLPPILPTTAGSQPIPLPRPLLS